MTPEELDQRLRAHTEGEQARLEGRPFKKLSMPTVKSGDVDIEIAKMENMVAYKTELAATMPGLSPMTKLLINRHGRFRSYPLHSHDFIELTYMYSGACVQIVNDGLQVLRQGQVLLMDSDVVHTIAPLGEDDILVNICIDKGYLNQNFFNRLKGGNTVTEFFVNMVNKLAKHNTFIIFQSEDDRRLQVLMRELLCEWYDASPLSETMITALFSCIVTELTCVFEQHASSYPLLQNNPVVPTLRYIEEHYADAKLEDIAAELYISPTSLTRALKAQTGKSFKTLVHDQRIHEACRLLEDTTLPVSAVAKSVGYSNLTFFYQLFERLRGCSPAEWRESRGALPRL